MAQKQHTWMQRVIQMAEQIEVYHGKTADFEANAGGELTVPLCELRESYVVEEIGVRLSEEISRLNDLEHCGCAVQEVSAGVGETAERTVRVPLFFGK